MRRVLKISVGLMGLMLILMTASLWISRLSEPQPRILTLGFDWVDNYEPVRLQTPNPAITISVSPALFRVYGPFWTADGEWGYFCADEFSSRQVNLYRIRASGHGFEKLVSDVDRSVFGYHEALQLLISPDGHWLSFRLGTDSGIHLLNIESRQIVNLPLQAGFPNTYPVQFSDDSQRFIFYAANENKNQFVHFQYWLNEGRLENTSELYDGAVQPFLTLSEEWLVIKGPHRNFRIRPDGSEKLYFMPVPRGTILPQEYTEDILAWLPEHKVIVMAVSSEVDPRRIIGFDLDSGVALWTIDDLEYGGISSDGEWLLFASREIIYRIRPNGTRFERIHQSPTGQYVGKVWIFDSPTDGEWLIFYESLYGGGNPTTIWRMRWDGNHAEPIFTYHDNADIEGWTTDHQWLLVNIFEGGEGEDLYYRIRPDGSDKRQVTNVIMTRFIHGSPEPSESWQPILLSFGGGSLIFAHALYCYLNVRRKRGKRRAD